MNDGVCGSCQDTAQNKPHARVGWVSLTPLVRVAILLGPPHSFRRHEGIVQFSMRQQDAGAARWYGTARLFLALDSRYIALLAYVALPAEPPSHADH